MKNNLPSIKDLVGDLDGYKKMDELNFLLNQEPPKNWIKEHPYIKTEITNEKGQKVKVPYKYLPIDKVEYLLRKIFKKYKIEVLREGNMFNAVYTTARVWYVDLITGEWMFHDGVGAYQLQTKGGTGPGDLSNINNGAVMMALPLSKTLAVKDACDMFGNLFGANLNRQDLKNVTIDDGLKSDNELLSELEELFNELPINSLYIEDQMNIERIIAQKEVSSYKKAISILKKFK